MYVNALTRSFYSPRNQALLAASAALAGADCFDVAGFNQWLELGRCVAKGQHGTKILMVCEKKGEAPADGSEPGKYRVCKTRTVFFKSQTVELGTSEKAA